METDTHNDDDKPAVHGGGDDHGDAGETSTDGGDTELHGLLAEFETPGALIAAARKVKNAGYTEFDCYSPFPVHGIDDAMGIKRTKLPLVVFGGGLTGLCGGLLLQWWMNAHNWPWNVSGKPTWSIPANIPIAYETTILLSVLTTFFGMWAANKLPQVWHPFFRLDRFAKVTDDGLFIGIEASDQRFELEQTKQLLVAAGATHVEECHTDARPEARTVPKAIYGVMIVLTVVALIPFALAYKARASKSSDPHWHVFSDMDFQPKAKSDQPFAEFADGRANRGEIVGTIARGNLRADDAYYRGLRDGPVDHRAAGGVQARRRQAQPRPGALQHLLRAVPRLRRRRPRHRARARRAARRRLGGPQPGVARLGRHQDAQRPALQHDLERLQHDDGLCGPGPGRRPLGHPPLRPRAPARPERDPGRTPGRRPGPVRQP
jgi:hypothetical protein